MEKWWVGADNLASATGLLWTTATLGSLTCEEGGNLSTRDLGFIYVSSEGRVGCEFIHSTQPTDVTLYTCCNFIVLSFSTYTDLCCVVLCCVVLRCVALRCVVSCCVVLCRVVLHAYCNYICYLALWCSPFHTCCTLWCVALYTYYMLFKRNIALLISCHTDIKLLPFYMFSCIHFASWCVALHT